MQRFLLSFFLLWYIALDVKGKPWSVVGEGYAPPYVSESVVLKAQQAVCFMKKNSEVFTGERIYAHEHFWNPWLQSKNEV